ncbi:MAG: alpha/beta fold hydrolase [Algisphaera sp.]
MPDDDLPTKSTELPERLARALGRLALRAGGYPGRQYVGTVHRHISRNRGGRRFTATSSDGTTLDAWFSPRDPTSPKRLPVVIAHGLFQTKERHFKRAWKLNARGHDAILFDHRAHGRSTGSTSTYGVMEKHDTKAVIDEAIRRKFIEPRVITMGFSLGGGTVLQHAPLDDRVAGVIALAPFCDFREAIRSFRRTLTPWMNERWILEGLDAASTEAGFSLDEASSLAAFGQITVPVLLVEAGRDTYLPGPAHAQLLAETKAHDAVTLITIKDATHNTLVQRTWPKLDRAIARFCADCV